MLNAFASLKCSKKCQHNVQKPTKSILYLGLLTLHGTRDFCVTKCCGNSNTSTPLTIKKQLRAPNDDDTNYTAFNPKQKNSN